MTKCQKKCFLIFGGGQDKPAWTACPPGVKITRVVRKPAFCICENKDADQLRGNSEADQRLCFRYIDITIPLLSIFEMSSL